MSRPNVVQAEFFLVNLKAGSLNKLLSECADRRVTGSPIKLTVRFFDEQGVVTSLAHEAQRLEAADRLNLTTLLNTKGWLKRKYLNFRSRYLAGNKLAAWERQTRVAVQQLEAVTRSSKMIAIERDDRHFRLVQENELHELVEAAKHASKAWLFVFKPNDLLADGNEFVAHAM